MAFGIETQTSGGFKQLDANQLCFSIEGTATGATNIAYSFASKGNPIVAHSCAYGSNAPSTLYANSSGEFIGSSGCYLAVCCRTNLGATPSGYGLCLYNSSGILAASSTRQHMNIDFVGTYTLGTDVTFTLPSIPFGRRYVAMVPATLYRTVVHSTSSSTWYDSSVKINSATSVSVVHTSRSVALGTPATHNMSGKVCTLIGLYI